MSRSALLLAVLLILSAVFVVAHAGANVTAPYLIKMCTLKPAYMAKFVGDEYLWICTDHCEVQGTDVVQVGYNNPNAWLVDVKTCSILKTVTTPSLPVFRFPECTFEDAYYAGTNAKVNGIPLSDILKFTDTTRGNFYGLGCYGRLGAVGYRYNGTLYIFDTATKTVIYKERIGDIRRLKVVGERFVIAGALGNPNLYIYEVDISSDTLVRRVVVPLLDGVGALDVTDIRGIGYILVGGSAGYIYIFNGTPLLYGGEPKLIFRGGPYTSVRFYNPFYDFHLYQIINVFAFAATDGTGVIYDPFTNTTTVVKLSGQAASVSPSGEYVFIGDTLFYVARRDPVTEPAIRIVGDAVVTGFMNVTALSKLGNLSTSEYKIFARGFEMNVTRILGEPLVSFPELRYGITDPSKVIPRVIYWTDVGKIRAFEYRWEPTPIKTNRLVHYYDIDMSGFTTSSKSVIGTAIYVPLAQPVPLGIVDELKMAGSVVVEKSQMSYNAAEREVVAFFDFITFGLAGEIWQAVKSVILSSLPSRSSVIKVTSVREDVIYHKIGSITYPAKVVTLEATIDLKQVGSIDELRRLLADLLDPVRREIARERLWDYYLSMHPECWEHPEYCFDDFERWLADLIERERSLVERRLEPIARRAWEYRTAGKIDKLKFIGKLVRFSLPAIFAFAIGAEIFSFATGVRPGLYDKGLLGASLVLEHPQTGKRLAIAAEISGELPDWFYKIPANAYYDIWRATAGSSWVEWSDVLKRALRGGGDRASISLVEIMPDLKRELAYVAKLEEYNIVGMSFFYLRFTELQQTWLAAIMGVLRGEEIIFQGYTILDPAITVRAKTKDISDPESIKRHLLARLRAEGLNVSDIQIIDSKVRVRLALPIPIERIPRIEGLERVIIEGLLKLDLEVVRKCTNITISSTFYGYNCSLHWTPPRGLPETASLNIKRIEIINLRHPVTIVERKYEYRADSITSSEWGVVYVNKTSPDYSMFLKMYRYSPALALWQSYGNLFELNGTSTFNKTRLYSLVSIARSPWLDPYNGGQLQRCKDYRFYVWHRLPPDAGIAGVLFNGTEPTATIPHYATIVVFSTVDQSVTIRYGISVKYYDESRMRWLDLGAVRENTTTIIARTGDNLITIPIGSIIQQAAESLFRTGSEATYKMMITISAEIVRADYDYLKSNNAASNNATFPVLRRAGYADLYVLTVDARNQIPIANAYVEVIHIATGNKMSAYTNSTGWAVFRNFTVLKARYQVCAEKTGYLKRCEIVEIVTSPTIVRLEMAPANVTPIVRDIPPPPEGYHLVVLLAMYEDGTPYQCAEVVVLSSDGKTICRGHTNGDGRFTCAVKHMTSVVVRARAYVQGMEYKFERSLTVTEDVLLTFTIPVLPPVVPTNKTTKLIVFVYDYLTGAPIAGAEVRVRDLNGTDLGARYTDASGRAEFPAITSHSYNVTVRHPDYRSDKPYYIVHVTKDPHIVNVPLVRKEVSPPKEVYWYVRILVRYRTGFPFEGAHVEIYRDSVKLAEGATNSLGQLEILIRNCTTINVLVVAKVNETYTYREWRNGTHVNNHLTLVFTVPAEVVKVPPRLQAKLVVRVLDVLNRRYVPNAMVMVFNMYRLTNRTDSSGSATFTVSLYEYYDVSAYHPDYVPLIREFEIFTSKNVTEVTYPVAPKYVDFNVVDLGNNTIVPPIHNVTCVVYRSLAVQTIFADGAPFRGANVTVTGVDVTGARFRTSYLTDDRGFAYFYVPSGSKANITISARYDTSTFTRTITNLLVDRSYWLVTRLPWRSPWFLPEVMLTRLEIRVWRAIGFFRGATKHNVLTEIWTNAPQNVTVKYDLYRVDETGRLLDLITSWSKNFTLRRGINVFSEFMNVSVLEPTFIRVRAEIVRYQSDTIKENNVMWSNVVLLRPIIDLSIFVYVNIVKGKNPPFVLPEDVIQISVLMRPETPIARAPAVLHVKVDREKPWMERVREVVRKMNVTVAGERTWHNFTLVVPWDRSLVLNVTIESPLDDNLINNVFTHVLSIDPNIKLVSVDVPTTVIEGSKMTVRYRIRTNVFAAIVYLMCNDTTLGRSLRTENMTISEKSTDHVLTVTLTAPENPRTGLLPTAVRHDLVFYVAGPDVYMDDNVATASVTVLSRQTALLAAAIIGLLVLMLIIAIVIGLVRRKSIEARETEYV